MNAELKVGAVEETITVTGETPLVDTASTKKQVVLDHDAVQNLPSSRQYFTLARMAAGTSGGGGDVGGSAGIADVGQSLTAHGSKAVDQRVMLNGVSIMTLQAGGNIGGQQPDVGSAAEIAIDTASLSAEGPTGGVRINFIPKDGGNRFSNSTFFTFANEGMQGTNYTDDLKARGLATPTKIANVWDLNESVGGPIMKDKAWFWFSTRFNRVNSYAGVFENKNAFNPNAWTYVPDENAPAENHGEVQQNNLRITWQAAPKIKVAFEQKIDSFCNCPYQAGAIAATNNGVFNSLQAAPEAARDRRFPRLRQEHVEFTSPVTNKLLFEFVGMHLFERWGNMDLRSSSNGGSLTDAEAAAIQNMISVADQGTGLMYRSYAATGFGGLNNTIVPNYTYRVAASYITGAHAFKTGWNDTFGYQETYNYAYQPISYTFNQGVPTFVTQYAAPTTARSEENHDFGAFAQDTWKTRRATVTGAIRYDWFKTSFPQQTIGPGSAVVGLQNRNITFPAQDNTSWKDLTYRSGAVFDVLGDGKSALKVAANKYLLGQTLNALGAATTNPVNAMQTFTNAQLGRLERQLRRGLQPGESACAKPLGEWRRQLRRDRTVHLWHDHSRRDVRSGSADRLGTPDEQLGILGGHPAAASSAYFVRRRLLPADLAELPGRRQRAGGRERFPAVHHDGADRRAAARRRRQFADLLQRHPDQVRANPKQLHAVGQVWQRVRTLERLRHQCQRPPREWSPVPGWDRHRANRRPTTATSSRSYPKC